MYFKFKGRLKDCLHSNEIENRVSFSFLRTDLLKLHDFLLCFRGIKRTSSRILNFFLFCAKTKKVMELLNKIFGNSSPGGRSGKIK